MKLHKILPHINLVLSIMMLFLIVFNLINPMMDLQSGAEFEVTLIVFISVGLLSSIAAIVHNAKCEKNK